MGKNNYNKNYNNTNDEFANNMEAPVETPVVEETPAAEVEVAPVVEEKPAAPAPKKEEKKATAKVTAKKVGGPARN